MISLRIFLKKQRHRIAVVAAVGALALAVGWVHGGGTHSAIGETASLCLAILDASGAILLLAGPGPVGLGDRRRTRRTLPIASTSCGVTLHLGHRDARAGPPRLQVFLR